MGGIKSEFFLLQEQDHGGEHHSALREQRWRFQLIAAIGQPWNS